MEDYYDSDYVPHDLIDRYNALQLEKRKRAEQQLTAATQVHDVVMKADSTALVQLNSTMHDETTYLSSSATFPASSQRPPEQQRTVRSSLRSPRRRSTSINNTSDCNHTNESSGNPDGSVPRQGPRTSVALDEIYAARQVSNGLISTLTTSSNEKAQTAARRPLPLVSPSRSNSRAAAAESSTRPPRTHIQPITAKKRVKKPAVNSSAPIQRDLYDSAAEARRQEHFFSESKRLGKPFVPSGGGSLDVPTRFMLGDCVKILYRSIVLDWREASPMVVSTAEDLIAVYFSLEKLEKAQVTALLQYMNACLLHSAAIREFHLTKVPEGWDVLTNDGYVLYTFRPPWVKKRVFLPDTINPLHAHLRDGEY